jgi:hypothetical protein
MLEHYLPVTGQVLGIDDGLFNIVFAEQISQRLLALNLGKLTQVSITPEQVECVIDQPVLSSGSEFSLQFGEICPAFMEGPPPPRR